MLNRHLVELADKLPALRAGQEDPIPYVSVVDPHNINPYRVRCGASARQFEHIFHYATMQAVILVLPV